MAKKVKNQPGYAKQLRSLQIGLTALQHRIIEDGRKLLVIVEGRDAAGKDGAIKRIVEHLSPRDTRVVALGPPSDRDRRSWYFQRWTPHLPAAGEIVLFNRSWYNRAGVERVMGFCSDKEYEEFMTTAPMFEQLLEHCGITLVKYYLDVSKAEQKKRLTARREDPLKQWKISPIDSEATRRWKAYSKARDEMLARTHSVAAPWTVVRADDKRHARLALIRNLLTRLGEEDHERYGLPDPNAAFLYDAAAAEQGLIAP
ncbi:polyphosphate kinase 2 [Sphingomonas sp. RT2P30]|uniref:polyphosphate kinase 2 n=1 Tax=Parasphingomonas halimpatiens TaxID=3096162 RepID=UPI002FCC1459